VNLQVEGYDFERQQYDMLLFEEERRRGREADAYEIVQGGDAA